MNKEIQFILYWPLQLKISSTVQIYKFSQPTFRISQIQVTDAVNLYSAASQITAGLEFQQLLRLYLSLKLAGEDINKPIKHMEFLKEGITQKTNENDLYLYQYQKMMEIQGQNTQDLLLRMKAATEFKDQQKIYRENSKWFSKMIKCQKNKFTFGFQLQNSQFIAELVKLIFSLFQKPNCKPLYPELIVLLNNIFNLDNRYMEEFLFDENILISLRKYFQGFCHQMQDSITKTDQNKAEISRINFELYSMIYFISMLICQNNKNQVHANLKKIFFTHTFIKGFLSLEIQISKKNEIYKLIGIILVFLVKKIDLSSWYLKIKNFILVHISKITDKKSQFNFIYCLRSIHSQYSFEPQQLRKYEIIPFLVENLNKSIHDYHLTYTLDLIRLILKKHPIIGYKFVNCGLIDQLKANFTQQPNLIACVLQQLKDSIESETKACLYNYFEQRLSDPILEKYALKCLIMFFPFRHIDQIIISLETGLLDKICGLVKKEYNARMIELSLQFYDVILEDIKAKANMFHEHIVQKISCLEIIEYTEASNQPIIKQLGKKFKCKLASVNH